MGSFGGIGFHAQNLPSAWGEGPNSCQGQFRGNNRGLSSYGSPLWSNSFSRDMGDYYDTEPIPFQDGSMPEVEVRAGNKNPAKEGLCRQGSGRKGRRTYQEEIHWEMGEQEKRVGNGTYQGESSGVILVADLRQYVTTRHANESKLE